MKYLTFGLIWLMRFMLGASLFSFAGVIICRLPRGEGIIRGRSRCITCGKVLGPAELVPCLSYLIQRGRCRNCGGKIPVRDFWLEVLGGLCAWAVVLRWGGETIQSCLALCVLFLLTIVAFIDYDTMEIYDRFHLLFLLCGVISMRVFPETGLLSRLTGCTMLSALMLIIALLIPNGFGGGDIKLAFSLGFLMGWRGILCTAVLSVSIAGFWSIWMLAGKRIDRKTQLAFSPFFCTGAAASFFYGNEITDWWLKLTFPWCP